MGVKERIKAAWEESIRIEQENKEADRALELAKIKLQQSEKVERKE